MFYFTECVSRFPLFQVSSINRVLRNIASSKEQSVGHHTLGSAAAAAASSADSVYDKLRMFNGQAAAASWASWYGAAASPSTAAAHVASQAGHLSAAVAAQHAAQTQSQGGGGGGPGGPGGQMGPGQTQVSGYENEEKKPITGKGSTKDILAI